MCESENYYNMELIAEIFSVVSRIKKIAPKGQNGQTDKMPRKL